MFSHKRIQLPESIIGKCYKSRGYNEYLRILGTEGGNKARCLSASHDKGRTDNIAATVKDVRIDDYNQADDYIMVREIEGDFAYPFDRISDEEYRTGIQKVMDIMRDKAFGSIE